MTSWIAIATGVKTPSRRRLCRCSAGWEQTPSAHFEPILRKVEATAKDKSVARLAEKARLGM